MKPKFLLFWLKWQEDRLPWEIVSSFKVLEHMTLTCTSSQGKRVGVALKRGGSDSQRLKVAQEHASGGKMQVNLVNQLGSGGKKKNLHLGTIWTEMK